MLRLKLNKRRSERLVSQKDNNPVISISYMGETIDANLVDINSEGIGFTISKHPFSIIDHDVVDLKLSNSQMDMNLPVRILYSYKLGYSGMNRRYGAYFLKHEEKELEPFIDYYCEPKRRESRYA